MRFEGVPPHVDFHTVISRYIRYRWLKQAKYDSYRSLGLCGVFGIQESVSLSLATMVLINDRVFLLKPGNSRDRTVT